MDGTYPVSETSWCVSYTRRWTSPESSNPKLNNHVQNALQFYCTGISLWSVGSHGDLTQITLQSFEPGNFPIKPVEITFVVTFFESRDSSVRTATGWTAEEPGFDSWQDKDIFLFSIAFRPTPGPTQLPTQWVSGVLSLGLRRLEHENGHSPPSTAEVKNE
jgi:hypothetical protein